jgi:hypothetical protein
MTVKQDITVTINTNDVDDSTGEVRSSSTTTLTAKNMAELKRVLDLAGIRSTNMIAPVVFQPEEEPDADDGQVDVDATQPGMGQPPQIDLEKNDAATDDISSGIANLNLGLDADFSGLDLSGLATEMEAEVNNSHISEMECTNKPNPREYDKYGYKVPGRAAVPVRQINGYGDNPWVLGMTEEGDDDNGRGGHSVRPRDEGKRDTSDTSTKNTVKEGEEFLQRVLQYAGLKK